MKGFISNIEQDTLENSDFRKVLYTGKTSQLVLMSIPVGGEIGDEVHGLDQFFRIEEGVGKVIMDGVEHTISDGTAFIVPAGMQHNVINTSNDDALKIYTIYAPPNHRDGVVHATKEEAEKDDEHFDGKTTE